VGGRRAGWKPGEPWNHNVHYYPRLLAAVPAGARRALDVGCGEGLLVRRLADRVEEVTGIDRDPDMIALARERSADRPGVNYVLGDFLTWPFEPASFDLVTAVASTHHMDFAAALGRAGELARPGGTVAIIGLARNATAGDWLRDVGGVPLSLAYRLRRGRWRPGAPIVEPTMSWGEVRATVGRVLPGTRFRRHALWRWSAIWRRP
jgi:SAM-dependent methyltransferase